MKYASFKYGGGTNYNQSVSSYTADTSTSVSFGVLGGFGGDNFGEGYFGHGLNGAYTVTYTTEIPTTVVFA